MLCLGYYFTHEMGRGSFSARDISMLNTEAAQTKIGLPVLLDALGYGYM